MCWLPCQLKGDFYGEHQPHLGELDAIFLLYFAGHLGITGQENVHSFNLLTDKTRKWSTAVWGKGGDSLPSSSQLIELFCKVFENIPEGKDVGKRLLSVEQRKQCAAEYVLELHRNLSLNLIIEHVVMASASLNILCVKHLIQKFLL